jgi:hypothetical protein
MTAAGRRHCPLPPNRRRVFGNSNAAICAGGSISAGAALFAIGREAILLGRAAST